jgi:hypothetical protein
MGRSGTGSEMIWALSALQAILCEQLTEVCSLSRLTSEQRDVDTPCGSMGVIGFDIDRHSRGSGSRMQGYLVNAPCKPIGANSKRTDFALAA